jgi:uncharacterized repeat protein (TIGR01451 family)
MMFCEKNDNQSDYYAFQAGAPSNGNTQMVILFDNTHSGSTACQPSNPNFADDAIGMTVPGIHGPARFLDLSYCGEPNQGAASFLPIASLLGLQTNGPPTLTSDTPNGGTIDGTGMETYSTATNSYTFELSHPMNSGDSNGHDYSLHAGSLVGWCVVFYDGANGHVWDLPTDCASSEGRAYGTVLKLGVGTTGVCDLAINKTMTPNPLVHSQPATVTLTVWNNANATCGGSGSPVTTTVTDNIPAGLTAPGPSPGYTVASSGVWLCSFSSALPLAGPGTITCTTSTPIPPTTQLNPFATITIPVTVTALPPQTVANCASVANPLDQNPANNQSCLKVPVIATSGCDLQLNKTMTTSPNDTQVTIKLTVTNVGNLTCNVDAPVKVTDTLPTGLTPVSASGVGWFCNLAVACSYIQSFPPGASSTITIIANATGPATVQNCAQLTFPPDTNPANNYACASASVVPEFPPGAGLLITVVALSASLALVRQARKTGKRD